MLNIKGAADHLTASGMQATEADVLRWIKDGELRAELNQRRKVAYKINMLDLTDFIIKKRTEELQARLERKHHEARTHQDQIDVLKTRLQIEQSKVKTLKKLLNSQIDATTTNSYPLEEFLGLNPSSNNHALKKEFKKLLKALHPDRGGDERLFKVFNEHYENLKS